jgi:hypothetical protein
MRRAALVKRSLLVGFLMGLICGAIIGHWYGATNVAGDSALRTTAGAERR